MKLKFKKYILFSLAILIAGYFLFPDYAAAAITRVQSGSNSTATSSLQVNWGQATTTGNLLVAVIACNGTTITPPASWSTAVSKADLTSAVKVYIFYYENNPGIGFNATFTCNNSGMSGQVVEYSGMATSLSLDKTTSQNGSTDTPDTGSTTTTNQADELWLGGFVVDGQPTFSNPTNSFSIVAQNNTVIPTTATLEKIVSATGFAQTGATITSPLDWAGVLATFKGSGVSTSSISGTVYTDEGTTNIGANKTVAVSINGAAAAGTDDTDSNGAYSITGLTVSAGDVLTLYIDGETEKGVTVTKGSGSDLSNIHIFQNYLITRCDNSCSLTNTNLATADNNGDTDISSIYSESGGAVTTASGKSLYIPASNTYAPGANVTVAGTFTNAGTYTTGTETLSLTGTSSYNFTPGSTIYNVTQNGSGGTYTLQGNLTVSNVLTITAGTLDASSRTITLSGTTGTPFTNSGTFTASTSTVSYTGNYGSGNTTVVATTYYNLTLNNASETYVLAANTIASNNLTITSGTLDVTASNYNLTVGGSWSNSGTFNARSATVTFNATTTGKTITSNGSSGAFYNLTLNGSGGGWTLQDNTTVSNILTITTGTLSGGSVTLTLSGTGTIFSNSGTFTGSTSTINITDTSSSSKTFIGGGSTFYDLSITGSGTGAVIFQGSNTFNGFTIGAPKTVTLTSGTTQTITSSFTCNGSAGNVITLNASTTSAAILSKSSGTVDCDYMDISYSTATGGATWYAGSNSTNSGNNSGWIFNDPPGTISGTVYTDEGTTNIGANKTVAVSINGAAAAGTDDTDSNGAYSITGLTVSAGDVLTLYIDGETEKGVTVTKSPNTALAGINIFQNYLITRCDNSCSLTNTNLDTAENNGDTDITNIFTASGGALAATSSLYIPSSNTYAPGGNVTVVGNFTNLGTYTTGTETLTLSGASGYNFTPGSTIYKIDMLPALTGTYNLQGNLTVSNQLILSAGTTFNANSYTITLSGTGSVFSSTGTFNGGTSTINITDTSSSSKTIVGGGATFYNMSITGSGSGAIIVQGSNTFNTLTIGAPKTITLTSGTTQTFNGSFTCNGSFGNVITLNASTTSAATLSKSSGTVDCDYMDISYSTATGGATWNAGVNSTDSGNNTGWNFGGGLPGGCGSNCGGGPGPTTSTPRLVQTHFRFYQNNAALNLAAPYAGEDVNYDVPLNTTFRIRLQIANTGDAATNITRRLEYREDNGPWNQITNSGANIRLSNTPRYNDGVATTALLTATGSFISGQGKDTGSDTVQTNLAAAKYIEDEYALILRNGSSGHSYQLRITNAGTALDSYNITPVIRSNSIVFDQTHFRIYKDDAALNASTPYAAEDQNYNIPVNTAFRVRLQIANTGTQSGNIWLRLEFKEDQGSWTRMTANTNNIRLYNTPLVGDGTSIVNSRLTPTGTFSTAGRFKDTGSDSPQISLAAASYVEYEYSLRLQPTATGHAYQLRVSNIGSDIIDNYSVIPLINNQDTNVPIQSNFNPVNGIILRTATPIFTFTINEPGFCRASTFQKSYDEMASDVTCFGSGGTNMKCFIPNLGSNGQKTIYTACKDIYGNKDTAFSARATTYTLDLNTTPGLTIKGRAKTSGGFSLR